MVIEDKPDDVVAFLKDRIKNNIYVPPTKCDPTKLLTELLQSLNCCINYNKKENICLRRLCK